MVTFSNGLLILIEGDVTDGSVWHTAYDWQHHQFLRAMKFGTMKSMGYPNPLTYSETFSINDYWYRFEIHNDWGPVYLENMNTSKKRRIQYFHITPSTKESIHSTTKVCSIE